MKKKIELYSKETVRKRPGLVAVTLYIPEKFKKSLRAIGGGFVARGVIQVLESCEEEIKKSAKKIIIEQLKQNQE